MTRSFRQNQILRRHDPHGLREWRYYGGDSATTKYSPLDQINRDSVNKLKIAWRWKSDNFGG